MRLIHGSNAMGYRVSQRAATQRRERESRNRRMVEMIFVWLLLPPLCWVAISFAWWLL